MLSNIADDLHPPNRASLPSHWRIKCEPSVEIVNLGQCDVTASLSAALLPAQSPREKIA
jgi:hypothetical protein